MIIPQHPFRSDIAEQIIKNSVGLTFKALWDTGATHSVITPGINSETIKPIYIIGGIILPNRVIFENWSLTESDIGGDGIDLLIGMDIISQGDFFLSTSGGKTKLCFCYPPHQEPIDLVERAKKQL